MDVFQVFCVLFHPLIQIQIRLMFISDDSVLDTLLKAPNYLIGLSFQSQRSLVVLLLQT